MSQNYSTPEISSQSAAIVTPFDIEAAVEAAFKDSTDRKKNNTFPHATLEYWKREGWNSLHRGGPLNPAEAMFLILRSWAHRDIAYYGAKGRPSRIKLREWAEGIARKFQKVEVER